jgi:hypothetical protein
MRRDRVAPGRYPGGPAPAAVSTVEVARSRRPVAEATLSRTSLVLSAALLSLGLACAHSNAAGQRQEGASSGPVALKFAWPDGFQSHVLVAHESHRSGSEPTRFIAHQRMVSERKGNEIWVFTRDLTARGNEPDLDSDMKVNEALVQVVAPDGRFRRAEGLEEALAALKGGSDDRESTRRALARSTALDWELMAGAWVGEKLAPDEVHRKQMKAYVPLLAAVEAVLDVEYGLEGRVPCTDEETDRRCVAVSYRARLAPEDRTATLGRVRRLIATAPDKPVPEDVHAEIEVLLVTDPETLVPHRLLQREALRVRLSLPDGRVRETEERSSDTVLFSEREQLHPRPESAPGSPRDL